jgi:hypothetical protein
MENVQKRLTTIVWYAAPLTLSSAFAWKSRIRSLRRINPTGAGYVSFDPARPANSLTTISTGDVLTLDATGIVAGTPGTYFDVDNGTAPSGQQATDDTMVLSIPAGPARVVAYPAHRLGTPAALLLAAGSVGTTELSLNGGPYLSVADASAAIAALPASTFTELGPGYTLQARVTLATATTSTNQNQILFNY